MDLHIKELDTNIIAPNSLNFMNPEQGGSKIVVIGKPGCFLPGTEILMYDGSIKNVECVGVGNLVMGNDGSPRKVLELCHDIDSMYTICPEKGESYTVNKKHDLVLKYDDKIEIISVEEYLKKPSIWKKKYKLFKSTGVDWPEKSTFMTPYSKGSFLYGERIGNEYKINSRKNRLLLLAGIIDSEPIQCCSFFNLFDPFYHITEKRAQILEDIIFVARSLGFVVIKTEYGCKITGENFKDLPLKVHPIKRGIKNCLLSNFNILYYGKGEYYGFKLDGNNLFLLKSFDVVKNTGKTTLITSLLYEKRDIFPVAMIMSGTEDSNGHYKKIIPSTFVYNKLEEKKIEDFVVRQKIAKKHITNPWGILLLDDCTDDPKLFNKPLFQGMYKNGRHWKLLFILSLQYCMDIKPVIRTNVDGVFILRETNLRNRKSLWENYAGVIPDFGMFCQIMDQLTSDYTSLYIHNATISNKLEDCLFWYRAKKVPENFRLGSKDFWKFHKARFNDSYNDPYV